MRTYIDVILPLPLWSLFTYALPQQLVGQVQVGSRVVVPFGKKKFYTAIVQRIHTQAPQGYEVKEVSALLDEAPILLPQQLAQPHMAEAILRCRVLALCPFATAWATMKMIRGDLRMSLVPREEGVGLVPGRGRQAPR